MLQCKWPVTLEISALLLNLEKEGLRDTFGKKYPSLLQMWNLITDVLENHLSLGGADSKRQTQTSLQVNFDSVFMMQCSASI